MKKYHHLLHIVILTMLLPGAASAADETFDSNGVKIRYVTEGKGVPVVLIHGWMSDSSMWGADLAGNTRLKPAEGFKVIALDCRGHGKSDKPHDVKQYGTEVAEDVVRLLDHLKIEKAHVVGYSSGAFIAGNIVARHPDRILSVVYAGQAPVIAGKVKATDFSECELFARTVDEGKSLGAYLLAIMPEGERKMTETQADALARMMYGRKDVKAFAAAGLGFKELAVEIEQLKRFTGPVLFIHGGNESAHVKNRVAMVHELLGRGEVRLVEGGNHMTTLMNPQFGNMVKEFLRDGKVK